MEGTLKILAILALAGVVLVLVLGLLNMARGGSPERSQQLMRWRIIMQFVAIAVVLAAIFVAGR